MRQKESQISFTQMLNRIRTGDHTAQDIDLLKTRSITRAEALRRFPGGLYLYRAQKQIDAHNEEGIRKAKGDRCESIAIDKPFSKESKEHLTRLPNVRPTDKSNKSSGLQYTLLLVNGLRYDISCNDVVADGLAIGQSGVLTGVSKGENNQPYLVWVVFDDPNAGRQRRAQYAGTARPQGVPQTATPLHVIDRQFPHAGINSKLWWQRTQIPLRCALARSIHRSQGSTEHGNVIIDLSMSRSDDYGMHYVAFSRVVDFDKLWIIKDTLKEWNMTASPIIRSEYERLHRDMPLRLTLPHLVPRTEQDDLYRQGMHYSFFNVRSLPAYWRCLHADIDLNASRTLFISETHLTHKASNHHPSFPHAYRCNKGPGTILYTKTPAIKVFQGLHGSRTPTLHQRRRARATASCDCFGHLQAP